MHFINREVLLIYRDESEIFDFLILNILSCDDNIRPLDRAVVYNFRPNGFYTPSKKVYSSQNSIKTRFTAFTLFDLILHSKIIYFSPVLQINSFNSVR